MRISGYDTFRGWGEEYERGTCLIYGTLGTVWEFDSFKVTREGYSACVITQGGVLPLVKWWTEADEDARAFLETL